jgi:hypothetical protein
MTYEATPISLKEYIESRICALDKRVDAAVANIKESTTSAFSASQKAIDKQEESQRAYNAGHNDLSKKMEDQYKMMMPRVETVGLFKGVDDKIETFKKDAEAKAEALRIANEKSNDNLLKEIASLRESRSQIEGKGIGNRELLAYIIAVIGIASAFLSLYSHSGTSSSPPTATVSGGTVTATGK